MLAGSTYNIEARQYSLGSIDAALTGASVEFPAVPRTLDDLVGPVDPARAGDFGHDRDWHRHVDAMQPPVMVSMQIE